MNYGYASIEECSNNLDLSLTGVSERYCFQLYHYVVSTINIADRDVLEVGCGRGGGAHFLKAYFAPNRVLGVDFSMSAIRLCASHRRDGLQFVNADAQSLPFGDQIFDVVVNIESSHCYSSIDTFFREVKRVLRPSGYFLYADFCQPQELDARRDLLTASGMSLVREDDITGNIVVALDKDHERRLALVKKYVGVSLSKAFEEFVGTRHSRIFNDFEKGRRIYFRFVMANQLQSTTSDLV